MKPMKPKPGKTINDGTDKLDKLNAAIDQMMAEKQQLLAEIRNSAHEAVVVFVDMVGSTQTKLEHQSQPEVWIYKFRRFYDVMAGYVEQFGGRVIKYIGDEVMAVFDGDTFDNDSANFIARVGEIQAGLQKATGEVCSLKVAVDRGRVYTIQLPGHEEPDVLGTVIDRCARISKYTKPGVVIASYEYRSLCNPAYTWFHVGEPDVKGIGKVKVFQLGENTVETAETIEIGVAELEGIKRTRAEQKDLIEKLTVEVQEVRGMNIRLQDQLKRAGESVAKSDQCLAENVSGVARIKEEFNQLIGNCKSANRNLPSVVREALFHYHRSEDWYPPTGFDAEPGEWEDIRYARERGLLEDSQDGSKVSLSTSHPKVGKALAQLRELNKFMGQDPVIEALAEQFEDTEECPFNLSNRDFWEGQLGL